MALSEKLVQVAFGRSLPEITHCLGLYLAPNVAFVAEVSGAGGKPKVEHLVRVPLPPAPAATQGTRVSTVLNTDVLSDTDRLAGLLKPALSQGKWHAEYAMVTLSQAFGILRYFAMPAVDQKFWKMAVPAEAKKYIPVQFDDLINDYQIDALAPGPDRRPRQGALFGVTQGKNLESVNALLAKLGLKLIGLELAPCSVVRLWESVEPSGGSSVANVHFDHGNVTVVLMERGVPIFVREVLLGAEAKVADRRKLDLTGCMDFTKKQLGAQRPGKVRLSGATPEMAGWQEALAQESQASVGVADSKKTLGIDAAEWGGLAAVGAAARHLVPNKIAFDLSGAGRVDDVDRRVALSVFSVAGVLTALFLCLGIYRHLQAGIKQAELHRLRSRTDVPAFQGKSRDQIEQLMTEMRQRSIALASVTGAGVKVTDILTEVVEDLPEQAWVTNLNYQFGLEQAVGAGAARQLSLSGSVIAASEAAEQDVAIRFKELLQHDERFMKAFGAVEVSVQGGGGKDGSRTSFSMNCAGRRGG